jgi:hypothetical protein
LDLFRADSRNANACNSRNERVGGRDVSRVTCTPHDPGGCCRKSASECQHLDGSVIFERAVGNDTVLDGISGSGSNCNSSKHLKDGAEYHGLSVRDGSRRDTGGPGIGYIICGL